MQMSSGNDIDLVEGGLMAAFPTWVGAREVDKSRKHKEKIANHDEDDW